MPDDQIDENLDAPTCVRGQKSRFCVSFICKSRQLVVETVIYLRKGDFKEIALYKNDVRISNNMIDELDFSLWLSEWRQ